MHEDATWLDAATGSGTGPTTGPATGPATGSTVRTICWSCGSAIEKQVPWRHRRHRHLRWQCRECDVCWSGPGTAA